MGNLTLAATQQPATAREYAAFDIVPAMDSNF
jgi:hypothetical protein